MDMNIFSLLPYLLFVYEEMWLLTSGKMFSLRLFFLLIVLNFNGFNALMHISEKLLKMLDQKIHNTEVPAKELYRLTFDATGKHYREEIGILLNPNTENEELFVVGAFGYYMEDSTVLSKRCVSLISILYFVDKNGYRPEVRHSTNCRPYAHDNRFVSTELRKSLVG